MKYFEFRVQIPVDSELDRGQDSVEAMNILGDALMGIPGAKMGLPKRITEVEYKG